MTEVMDSWLCKATDRRLVVMCAPSMLTAFTVRQFAAKRLGVEPSDVVTERLSARYSGEATVVEVRWTGDDYAHGGSTNGRRLQEWSPSEEEWVDA